MYRGFKLSRFDVRDFLDKAMYNLEGRLYFEDLNTAIHDKVQELTKSENYIDGTAIQEAWFPQIDCNVFISHSHKDHELAIQLSGLLIREFDLKPFVDSAIWGYANNLLKEIDNEYCTYVDEETSRKMYDYEKRNYTTSHVHLMLASAIATMIDRSEVLIFLDTPNSLNLENDIAETTTTASPWLYFEIGTAKTTRIDPPTRYKEKGKTFSKSLLEAYDPEYKMDLSHLISIDNVVLEQWIHQAAQKSEMHPLDVLYEMKPPARDKTLDLGS